jgi:hypothetical protein
MSIDIPIMDVDAKSNWARVPDEVLAAHEGNKKRIILRHA